MGVNSFMGIRNPTSNDPNALSRNLDPHARGVLRGDIPNFWAKDAHALSRMTYEQVLHPEVFDNLAEVNKRVVIARVKHVLDILYKNYFRKEPPPNVQVWPIRNFPVLFVRTEDMWRHILELTAKPGADGGIATDPAAAELVNYLDTRIKNGDLVDGKYLEECFEHGKNFLEDPKIASQRQPILNLSDLDSDDVHAFLCAYETCFHP
jgi:hypothetical protein